MHFQLDSVRIFTRDWERALAFYSKTLGMRIQYANAEAAWGELDTGAACLAVEGLAPDDPEADGLIGRFIGVSLRVDDIETTFETLVARGVVFREPPTKQPWGGSLAHFEDPDGNVLTLVAD